MKVLVEFDIPEAWMLSPAHTAAGIVGPMITIAPRPFNQGVEPSWRIIDPAPQQGGGQIPDDVMYALDRMDNPLDNSWLKHNSVTAEEDKRCMKLIRDYIMRAQPERSGPAQEPATIKESLTVGKDSLTIAAREPVAYLTKLTGAGAAVVRPSQYYPCWPTDKGAFPVYKSPQPTAEREGWRWVPVEPTTEMREAFNRAQDCFEDGLGESPDSHWRAMIEAAPNGKEIK